VKRGFSTLVDICNRDAGCESRLSKRSREILASENNSQGRPAWAEKDIALEDRYSIELRWHELDDSLNSEPESNLPRSGEPAKAPKYSNMNRLPIPSAAELLTILAALVLPPAAIVSGALGQNWVSQGSSDPGKIQTAPGTASNSRAEYSASPHCDIAGKKEITITCHYTATPAADSRSEKHPRIVLNDAVLSFKTNQDNHMHVELTFTNEEMNSISDSLPVYLAIDDDSGSNYLRRLLPHINLRNLAPGSQQAMSERLLVPALQPRHYIIRLWIPNPDPYLKFEPSHNFLLSSVGVPNQESGMNTIATFSVVR
jgi:hypothetical protein